MRAFRNKILGFVCLALLAGLAVSYFYMPALAGPAAAPVSAPAGAVDLDLSAGNRPFYVLTVLTSASKKVKLPAKTDVAIIHLGLQNDGSTASATTDYFVVMHASDSMAANTTDGEKAIVYSEGGVTIQGRDAKGDSDGDRVVNIKAVGNGCKIQFVLGNTK